MANPPDLPVRKLTSGDESLASNTEGVDRSRRAAQAPANTSRQHVQQAPGHQPMQHAASGDLLGTTSKRKEKEAFELISTHEPEPVDTLDDREVPLAEGKDWVAFFPLNPATPGHTLVIPRVHVENIWKVTPSLGGELMAAVIRVGHAIEQVLNPEGMNLITSAGTTAEQTVFHLHLHIVPRWHRDGFGRIWPMGDRFDDADLTGIAHGIRDACASLGA